MRVAVGCDHNGLELKRSIMDLLVSLGHEPQDFGCYTADSVDYPDIAARVAQAVARDGFAHGILVCGTGIGMSIAANKTRGVRAALCNDVFSAERARQHNDANILCLGGQVLDTTTARDIVRAYLQASFEGGRHARRVGKIGALES